MMKPIATRPSTNLFIITTFGVFALASLFGAGAFWATVTEIQGAVIASGQVAVAGKPKTVQHLDGGIVDALFVSDGDKVAAGDPLVLLDDTLLAANLSIYRNRLAEALARQARLTAEQIDADSIDFDYDRSLLAGINDDKHRKGQTQIFLTRREIQEGRSLQLAEKIKQFENQISGVESQIGAKKDQLALLEEDLGNTETLSERGLARGTQLSNAKRAVADMRGQIAEHQSERARIENSIRDSELQLLQLRREFREEVVTELREVTSTAEELVQQIISTEKQLERVEVRAPVAGTIHEMAYVTLGGVVPPGASITQIIPDDEIGAYELRVTPDGIDQVFLGQEARVRFSAFNQRTTPEIFGEVSSISPNSIVDEATGLPFYRVYLTIPQSEISRLGNKDLLPGMPIEGLLQTEPRTVISYLTKPLTDQFQRAFREE